MSIKLAAVGAVALSAFLSASASAGVVVTHATVNHSFTLLPYPTGNQTYNTTPLDTASPGGSFSTLNNNALPVANGLLGVTANLGFFGGTVKLDATHTGAAHATMNDEYASSTTGVIDFNTGGGLLSSSVLFTQTGSLPGSGSVRVTNLSTGDFWNVAHSATSADVITGALSTTAAPAGDYRFTWNWSGTRMAGMGTHGIATVSLAVTPEPTTAVVLAAIGGIVTRRRR